MNLINLLSPQKEGNSMDVSQFSFCLLICFSYFIIVAFDHDDVFGKRKNTTNSPYIRAQLDLDNKIIYIFLGFTMLFCLREVKEYEKIKILRTNQLNSVLGWVDKDNLL